LRATRGNLIIFPPTEIATALTLLAITIAIVGEFKRGAAPLSTKQTLSLDGRGQGKGEKIFDFLIKLYRYGFSNT